MSQDVQVVQLSKNNVAITFNKHALVALKEGRSQLVQMKVGRQTIKFLICRDHTLTERMSEFRQKFGDMKEGQSFFSRVKSWFGGSNENSNHQ